MAANSNVEGSGTAAGLPANVALGANAAVTLPKAEAEGVL